MPVEISEVVITATRTPDQVSNPSPAEIQSATVVDNKDPDQMGRVKVSFMWDNDNTSSSWARVAQPLAGNKYGSYFLPEVGDEVLVAFANNNHNSPVVIGSFYNGQNKQADCADDNNYIKNIKTKSGNEIRFTDKPGEEEILIVSKTNTDNQIILSLKDDGKITIQSKGKIEIKAPEVDIDANKKFNLKGGEINISGSKITIHADGDIALNSEKKIVTDAKTGIEINSKMDVKFEGLNVTVEGQVGATLKGGAKAEVSGGAETTIKGAMVMIN